MFGRLRRFRCRDAVDPVRRGLPAAQDDETCKKKNKPHEKLSRRMAVKDQLIRIHRMLEAEKKAYPKLSSRREGS